VAWGISGDLPILTVTIRRCTITAGSGSAAGSLVLALRASGGSVILNQESPGYEQRCASSFCGRSRRTLRRRDGPPGGVFLRDGTRFQKRTNLIVAASSLVLSGGRGPLQQQLAGTGEVPRWRLSFRRKRS